MAVFPNNHLNYVQILHISEITNKLNKSKLIKLVFVAFLLETHNKKVNSYIQKIKANLVKISIDKYLTQAYNLILESSMTIFRHLILQLGNRIAM